MRIGRLQQSLDATCPMHTSPSASPFVVGWLQQAHDHQTGFQIMHSTPQHYICIHQSYVCAACAFLVHWCCWQMAQMAQTWMSVAR